MVWWRSRDSLSHVSQWSDSKQNIKLSHLLVKIKMKHILQASCKIHQETKKSLRSKIILFSVKIRLPLMGNVLSYSFIFFHGTTLHEKFHD